MLLHLLESRRARHVAAGALAASLAIHFASAGAAIGTRTAAGDVRPESVISVRYLLPPDKLGGAVEEHVTFVGAGVGSLAQGVPSTPDLGRALAADGGRSHPTPPADSLLLMPPPPGPTAIYTAEEVDSAVTRDPTSGGPVYPPSLLAKGVEGEALVEFTVDTSGHADSASFSVVHATDPLFAGAVRDALPVMRFTPAVVGGRRVRQLVRLPMRFKLLPTLGERGA